MNFLPPPNQPINLLRSIAKVRVELSEDLKKFVEVTPYQPGNANTGCVLNYKHAVGYLAPLYSYYQTRTDVQSNLYQDRVGGSSTGAFTNEYIHQFANAQKDQTGHAPFFKDEKGAFYIYMYEHQINEANISMQFHWTADALQKDPVYHTYTLHFADYEAATQAAKNKVGAANWKERPLTDEELQPYKFPVMRNHYYTYTITKLNPLELKYEVCDWINKPDIDIVFGEVGVSSITLDPTTLNLEVGPAAVDTTATITATVLPSVATNKSLTWTSSNPDVATVIDDPVSRAAGNSTVTVKAIAPGEATVTAMANDGSGKKATCAVTVRDVFVPVTSITLNKTSETLNVNGTLNLTATVKPDNATDKTVTWSCNNSNATVDQTGKVTAKAPGTAIITATAKDGSGVKATCNITIKQPVTSITLNKTSATINVNGTVSLTATVKPDNASNKNVTWSTSNANIAIVSNGVVTGKAPGTVTITATAADGSGVKATCTVTVKQPVTNITLSPTSATIEVGKTITLTPTITPSNASNKSVTWSTSNGTYATVSNGVVTGKAVGTVTITATAADGSGKKATCTVTVKAALPAGALPGEFTINSSGKKVYFSKGNLQATYNGSSYAFGFAANQYDFIGDEWKTKGGNKTISNQTSGKVVDLFGWSTSKTNYGISTSENNNDYSGAFVDWGTAIDKKGTWRTLSKDEWDYLLYQRTVKGGKGNGYSYSPNVYYLGTVGLVLYPDNYKGNGHYGVTPKLDEGVVYLPQAGSRSGSEVRSSEHGNYWSSTYISWDINSAHYVFIHSTAMNVSTNYELNRYMGLSVRLVTDKK